jgi:uncharacterized protein YukE
MSAVSHGATPAELNQLGVTLKNQIDPINSVIATVRSSLSGTNWTGPARDRFQSDWENSFKTALDRLIAAFDAAGRDCVSRAEGVERVLGAR